MRYFPARPARSIMPDTLSSPKSAATDQSTEVLFRPLRLGALTIPNRIIMAPMSRMRSTKMGIPSTLNAKYYAQRAKAGLLISEATCVSRQGMGYSNSPGLYNLKQLEGWRRVCDAVHAAKGHIFLQLWHVGRISHSSLQPYRRPPVAPSAVGRSGDIMTADGAQPFETPRALSLDEISALIADYKRSASMALEAGFDGVEVQCANGFLLEQFLNDNTNRRTDQYGGPMENRARLFLEVLDSVCEVWGEDRVGVRLSPFSTAHECIDSDPVTLHRHVVSVLAKRNLAYLHFYEPRAGGAGGADKVTTGVPYVSELLRPFFSGVIIAAGGFDGNSAASAVNSGILDAVAFGRIFVSNPDLPHRIKLGLPYNQYDRRTFYSGGKQGYTDYPFAT
jgi:N-ethylmaleimide reductase